MGKAKQKTLPGMEDPAAEALEEAVATYVKLREAHAKATEALIEAKTALAQGMKKLKRSTATVGDHRVEVSHTLQVKVTSVTSDGGTE